MSAHLIIPWGMAAAVLGGAALDGRAAPRLVAGVRGATAAAGLGLGAWGLQAGALHPAALGLVAAASLVALCAPAGAAGRGVSGAAFGMAAAAAALGHLGLAPAARVMGPGAWIFAAAAAALALALGFALRAGARSAGAGGVSAAAAGALGLAFGAWAMAGGQGGGVHLPLAGADGTPALWMSDLHAGLLATAPFPEVGVALAAAAALALASLWPAAARLRLREIAAGVALLAIPLLLAREGAPVELDPEAARQLLSRLGVAAPLVESPRLLASGPYMVRLALLPLPVGLAFAGAGALVGQVFAQAPQGAEASASPREALIPAAVFTWVGVALLAVVQHLQAGLWLSDAARDQVMLGAAFGVSAALAGLWGLGARQEAGWVEPARAVLTGLAAAALASALAGGLVGAQGIFGL